MSTTVSTVHDDDLYQAMEASQCSRDRMPTVDELLRVEHTLQGIAEFLTGPIVSGVVALMLQANPNLTWRDVKHILANTAQKNDPTDAGWSLNGGQHWIKIGGVPTIAVREIAIQKRDNDLVLGTFGRGIYIVDDYSPVRLPPANTCSSNR